MNIAPKDYVTREEVENSYEFKLIKRIIKRDFPFILDITLPPDDELNKYYLIFVDMVFNPFILQRQTGWLFMRYIKSYYGALSDFQQGPIRFQTSFLSTIYDINRSTAETVAGPIERTMSHVSTSPAIPQDLKLGKERKFVIGSWKIPRDIPLPQDAMFAG